MKNLITKIIFFLGLVPVLSHGQISQKVWYDGNSRAMFYRDALSGDLKDVDTTSTRSEGEGYTAIDLGMHFTPNDEIEIFSEIRIKNDFGYMWGSGAYVDLRRLSVKGILNDRISFNLGDMYLKQTVFTLNNFGQELSKYEPSVFQAYRDLIEYENFYLDSYWRMQGLQSNFSYTFYNAIRSVEADFFASRVRGVEWLGEPELLMLGGTSLVKLESGLSLAVNHVNSFEVQSSSLDTATYYNPVTNVQIKYAKKTSSLTYRLSLDVGGSVRGWKKNNETTVFETSGGFVKGKIKAVGKTLKSSLSFSYVDPDFRSAGAQSRRVNYISAPSSYAYYTNNTLLRPVSLMDITTDPNIYSHRLSTSLMQYNTLYSAVSPYGEATPNRAGASVLLDYKNNEGSILTSADVAFFQEVIGQGTEEKRSLFSSGLSIAAHIDKMTPLKNKTVLEASVSSEGVNRGGSELESISFNSLLFSAGLSYELFKNLKLIGGIKSFSGRGNEVGAQRDEYDQIVGYELLDFDSKEDIMMLGLQYNFTNDIYFSLQTNQIEIDDKTSDISQLSLSRIYFMFNMNL
jgi:hypothetical protein